MKKNAGTFRIEPNGFSIHTFELSKKVTNNDYKRMRDRLYCQRPKGEIYRDRAWQGELVWKKMCTVISQRVIYGSR